ncbi:MAG TPA: LysE family translocator [Actinomycetota bacterium]|nr:LysE family translocator [Actinomycetota bacterium]
MSQLLGLAGFALVGSITPGPNNSLLLASGSRFGFRRTAPHVAGTAVGMGALVFAVAGGVGVVLLAVPGIDLALKVVGSAYLLYLAARVLGSRGAGATAAARPLGLLGGVGFQFANPKGWLFALAAAGTFLPPGLTPLAGAVAVATTCAVVILGTAAVWAAGGAALHRLAEDGRAQRVVNVALALVLAASVAFIWV